MKLQNINEYQQEPFEKKFKSTDLYQSISQDFDLITFSKLWNPWQHMTSRERYAGKRIFSAVPFYYLEFLTSKNPSVIYDLGCGWNIFKKYIPNVIGIGGETPSHDFFHADIHGYVDNRYVAEHQDYFESVFSINALHFIPLGFIKKRVSDFYSMLKPGGTGWLSLNIARMISEDLNFHNKDSAYLDDYVRNELSIPNISYLVFDVDLSILDEYMDGNIRLVMTKSI